MNLPELIKQLENGKKNYNVLLNRYKSDDWKMFEKYTQTEEYSQIKLYENENVILKLLCWLPEQRTDLHNHPLYISCDFKILKGCLYENVFSGELKLIDSNIYRPYSVGNIDCFTRYHTVSNNTDNKSVSLHIYHKHK